MQNADLFLLCSYTEIGGYKEGTPVVLMEAQACGVPCIASQHAGIPEIVKHQETGILTKEQSIDEISNAIAEIYFNSDKHKQMSKNARNHIINEFNHKVQNEKTNKFVFSILLINMSLQNFIAEKVSLPISDLLLGQSIHKHLKFLQGKSILDR